MFEQFVTDLTHTDPLVRYEAAQKLGASSDNRAVEHLIAALTDANAKVQYAAFSGLIKLKASEAFLPMLDLLLADPSSRIWELLKLNIGMRLRNGLLDMVPVGNAQTVNHLHEHLGMSKFDLAQRAFLIRLLWTHSYQFIHWI